jgi:hypothetical protein
MQGSHDFPGSSSSQVMNIKFHSNSRNTATSSWHGSSRWGRWRINVQFSSRNRKNPRRMLGDSIEELLFSGFKASCFMRLGSSSKIEGRGNSSAPRQRIIQGLRMRQARPLCNVCLPALDASAPCPGAAPSSSESQPACSASLLAPLPTNPSPAISPVPATTPLISTSSASASWPSRRLSSQEGWSKA